MYLLFFPSVCHKQQGQYDIICFPFFMSIPIYIFINIFLALGLVHFVLMNQTDLDKISRVLVWDLMRFS